jgi:hypothetical protein
MADAPYARLAQDLIDALGLQHAPLAVTFSDEAPARFAPFGDPIPASAADGRTGRVAAVFGMRFASVARVLRSEGEVATSRGLGPWRQGRGPKWNGETRCRTT